MTKSHFRDLPSSFKAKKQKIIESLSVPQTEYADNSPKGSVDYQIADLIDQINAVEGWVTTSSCAGRASVYAEGAKGGTGIEESFDLPKDNGGLDEVTGVLQDAGSSITPNTKQNRAGPGGKGFGGCWLYVSHESLPMFDSSEDKDLHYTKLFGLDSDDNIQANQKATTDTNDSLSDQTEMRLIRLEFSPLILHIHAATLHHARPLLSAAINAGFRESGVQTLKALEDPEAGTMVAIRTAGLVFETVVGRIRTNGGGEDMVEKWVDEKYLSRCVKVINERFVWNAERREKLRAELRKVEAGFLKDIPEDKDERRIRKKREGLQKQKRKQGIDVSAQDQRDILDEELCLDIN